MLSVHGWGFWRLGRHALRHRFPLLPKRARARVPCTVYTNYKEMMRLLMHGLMHDAQDGFPHARSGPTLRIIFQIQCRTAPGGAAPR